MTFPLARRLSLLTAVGAAALCLPATSGAYSGGAAMGPPPSQTPQPANLIVSASADGMTIAAPESAPLRTALKVSGDLPTGNAGRTVDVEVMGARTNWSWVTAAQAQVAASGGFSTTWNTSRAGQFAVRAVVSQTGAGTASTQPTITVNVYRASLATLYGPGFYGHRTACGTVLRKRTFGVANRTLPCGTRVAVYYEGQMLVVPVIDRGPYANGANWDLTMATGAALGIDTTATIGAVALPRPN
jgi:rare lipoprotein A